METATGIAVCVFNQGAKAFKDMLKQMDIEPGQYVEDFCAQKDTRRIKQAQKMALSATKEARQAKRRTRLQADEASAETEGQPYAAGAYWHDFR